MCKYKNWSFNSTDSAPFQFNRKIYYRNLVLIDPVNNNKINLQPGTPFLYYHNVETFFVAAYRSFKYSKPGPRWMICHIPKVYFEKKDLPSTGESISIQEVKPFPHHFTESSIKQYVKDWWNTLTEDESEESKSEEDESEEEIKQPKKSQKSPKPSPKSKPSIEGSSFLQTPTISTPKSPSNSELEEKIEKILESRIEKIVEKAVEKAVERALQKSMQQQHQSLDEQREKWEKLHLEALQVVTSSLKSSFINNNP